MLKNFEMQVEVTGHAASKQHAVAAALADVQRAVSQPHNNVLLRIQPLNVDVIEAREIRKTEKFLFFFLPRERRRYVVRLRVSVSVSVIDINSVAFQVTVDRSL